MAKIKIIKESGEREVFSAAKLRASLKKSGATNKKVSMVMNEIKPFLYDGISTKEIYKKAFSLLKKSNRAYASKYSLKRALFDMGPTGYPFEHLISGLLKHQGYTTRVGVILDGECVTHEIDVLAEKDKNLFTVECKFHSKSHFTSNVKTPLYVNSRFIDIQNKWNNDPKNKTHLKQGWLVTNTRFTDDAIRYANCIGLRLLSWNYPKNNGIANNIDTFCLYPITVLTTITKKEKEEMMEKEVILIEELFEASNTLKEMNISSKRIPRIMAEVENLIEAGKS